jgi:hypothetical protein
MHYREPQSEYFGKKGISWHIAVVSTRHTNSSDDDDDEDEISSVSDEDEDKYPDSVDKLQFNHNVFVHVFDQVVQDSEAVLAILEDILYKIKLNNPSIQQAFIRSDNAGCYHSAQSILSMPTLSKKTGIKIERVDFSDPQGGKGYFIVLCFFLLHLNFTKGPRIDTQLLLSPTFADISTKVMMLRLLLS